MMTTSTVLPLLTDITPLQTMANKLRQPALEMIFKAQSGHPGTSFSCMEILVALWFGHMKHQVSQPDWAERDRFVMSKGHGAPALYAVLMELGYLSYDEIGTLRQVHSRLQGHPASKYVAGVDVSTGSLGQGLSAAVGMALGLRLDQSNARVYCLLGDGECQEGNVWEAFMSGAHHQVSRLTAIVDRNVLQIDGSTEQVKAVGNMAEKVKAFGWHVIEVQGHDMSALLDALRQADHLAETSDKPTCIVAHTTKGKGVSFMENQAGWHGKAPNQAQFDAAMTELKALLA
ncbi:MAG: transketolase [Vampirovibrionales bacterium]